MPKDGASAWSSSTILDLAGTNSASYLLLQLAEMLTQGHFCQIQLNIVLAVFRLELHSK